MFTVAIDGKGTRRLRNGEIVGLDRGVVRDGLKRSTRGGMSRSEVDEEMHVEMTHDYLRACDEASVQGLFCRTSAEAVVNE